MKTAVIGDAIDLWEAWIDVHDTAKSYMLYVLGDVCTGKSKTVPVLLKKNVQGAGAGHLFLEIMPGWNPEQGRLAEVRYAEPITDIKQYRQISICAGEDVIAHIHTIEVVY